MGALQSIDLKWLDGRRAAFDCLLFGGAQKTRANNNQPAATPTIPQPAADGGGRRRLEMGNQALILIALNQH
jgi:hypothetical protein